MIVTSFAPRPSFSAPELPRVSSHRQTAARQPLASVSRSTTHGSDVSSALVILSAQEQFSCVSADESCVPIVAPVAPRVVFAPTSAPGHIRRIVEDIHLVQASGSLPSLQMRMWYRSVGRPGAEDIVFRAESREPAFRTKRERGACLVCCRSGSFDTDERRK